jgi:hypothetical protein
VSVDGIPRNCILIQLRELPAHYRAVREGHPMSEIVGRGRIGDAMWTLD